jgi:hypothetical protein
MSQQLQAGCCCGDVVEPPPELTCLSPCPVDCNTAYFSQVVATGNMLGGTYILVASSTLQQGQFGGCVFVGTLNGSLTISNAFPSYYNGTWPVGGTNEAEHVCINGDEGPFTRLELDARVNGLGGNTVRFPRWTADLDVLIQCPNQSANALSSTLPDLEIGQPSGVPLFGTVNVWQWSIT